MLDNDDVICESIDPKDLKIADKKNKQLANSENATEAEKYSTEKDHIQDAFLKRLSQVKMAVSIYLVSGIKLQGRIGAYDTFVILLEGQINQLVYKHAISTIVPESNIDIPI